MNPKIKKGRKKQKQIINLWVNFLHNNYIDSLIYSNLITMDIAPSLTITFFPLFFSYSRRSDENTDTNKLLKTIPSVYTER